MTAKEIIAEVEKLAPAEREEILAAVRGMILYGGEKPAENHQSTEGSPEGSEADVWDVLERFAGSMPDLPEDMSINLDHYLYGTPKRKP